ncbi:MAG: hypothetical protein ABSA11_13270 [Candidatus Bathyarchaeia archaeon]|jgi:hypothetical protein
MKFNEIKILTILVSIFIITIIWITYLRGVININKENQFLAMGIIGNNNTIENYYSNNNTEIKLGSNNHWNISVTNNMDNIQYLDIKVKILPYNETLQALSPLPNSASLSPSPATTIYNIPFFITKGSTVYHNFTWSIENPSKITYNDNTSIGISTIININNSKYPVDLSLPIIPNIPDENNFVYSRIVFELWTFNENTNTFSFVINTPTKSCVWNQLFFKINLQN